MISGLCRGRLVLLGAQQPKKLVSELDNVFLLGGQLCFEISVQLLVQGLCSDKVLLHCILSLATPSTILLDSLRCTHQLERYWPGLITCNELHDEAIGFILLCPGLPILDLVVVMKDRFDIKG